MHVRRRNEGAWLDLRYDSSSTVSGPEIQKALETVDDSMMR